MSTFFQKQQQVAALDLVWEGSWRAPVSTTSRRSSRPSVRARRWPTSDRSFRRSLPPSEPPSRTRTLRTPQQHRKALYIHMLGYPAHFGQIECLKLVATPRFTDKRLGYLGIMLLLDREHRGADARHQRPQERHGALQHVRLRPALCTFANIASEEMSRDLCTTRSRSSWAAATPTSAARPPSVPCASSARCPISSTTFADRTRQLLSDKNHGVLLCAVTLAIENRPDRTPTPCKDFRRAVPLLVQHLKSLVTTGYSPEHDVSASPTPSSRSRSSASSACSARKTRRRPKP